ncbi:amidohydrolase family protein [Bradyrhizobium sp. LHD-71]|uniref:amidohydrolase family protein n=1 Tax=Bradyrhizobium sp. LHD-71 TaxID=3072141 RepID=UPI00280FB80F|nr:amidohydrolase family protein [Bradyrhizobium sp. LHD-71]MDQ8726284.1 amidohydrolase family protein [Bradyrhizobium sp. LHD-71]
MSTTLVRSKTMITGVDGRTAWDQIDDGALLQEDGIIVAIGTYDDLKRKYPTAPVVGTGNEIVVPGFVNGHHHIGLTPVQLGSPDMPLELWFITRLVIRSLDLYLDTLYSAFEMIGSGITTVQHIHGWMPGTLADIEAKSNEVIRAYEDIGMRVSYCYAVRDQNRLVYQADEDFVASLPKELQEPMKRYFGRFKTNLEESMALFTSLHGRHQNKSRVKIQLAPANLHWCSDKALAALSETSKKYNVPLHMHLLETAYQKEYAKRRGGGTAVDYIERFDLLSPRLTLGHGVWLNENDIDKMAAAGACVCHNCSSNFRLRSGVAALNRFEAKGINTAIGLDEAGLNDDRDMLQEMRLVLRAHRVPGMDDLDVPTMAQVLRMATVGGARTTPYGGSIGTLEVGKAADLSLHDWKQISYPYLDEETPLLDAVIQRAKSSGVTAVMCDGEVIYADGKFTKIDRDSALKALHDDLSKALADDEVERRNLSKALLPHVRKFYADYIDPRTHEPFYRPSSMV